MKLSDFNLPEFQFVGGNRFKSRFRCYRDVNNGGKDVLDLYGATATFSLVNFQHPDSIPNISKKVEIHQYSGDNSDYSEMFNVIFVQLEPEETVDLFGRYTYQLTVIDKTGAIEVPGQGTMFITKNQDPNLIR